MNNKRLHITISNQKQRDIVSIDSLTIEIQNLINIIVLISESYEVSDRCVSDFHKKIKAILFHQEQQSCFPLSYIELISTQLLMNKMDGRLNNKFILVFLSATNSSYYKCSNQSRKTLSELIYEEKKKELGEAKVRNSIYYKLR